MKVCSNCSHENNDSSKFCGECGAKLHETAKFCPECGTSLNGVIKFCPECGYNLALLQEQEVPEEERLDYTSLAEDFANLEKEFFDSYSNSRNELNDKMAELDRLNKEVDELYSEYESDYSGDNDDENYEEDYETTEEKIKKIVDKYIKTINKSNLAYTSGAVQNPEYSQVIQNVRTYIAKNVRQADIYGFIDVTVFGKGKNGLVFTNDTLYLKEPVGRITLPYNALSEMYIKGTNLYFKNTKGFGTGLNNFDEVHIDDVYYNLPALKDCLEEIQAVL
ncbi:MAG: zinc ribbon domain-containing protein [Treponema sp.]